MEIKITLNEYADLPFLKKLLKSLKGVSDFELVKNEKTAYSWGEIESSENFGKAMERADADYKC